MNGNCWVIDGPNNARIFGTYDAHEEPIEKEKLDPIRRYDNQQEVAVKKLCVCLYTGRITEELKKKTSFER